MKSLPLEEREVTYKKGQRKTIFHLLSYYDRVVVLTLILINMALLS